MFFRKRKKKFTQINTFQDESSGWESGLVRQQNRLNRDEMYQITLDMMKKGSTHTRGNKTVRQFGVMVGTDLKLVTSGDFVDRETYEALLAVDVIEAPNHQMNIPGIGGDRPVLPQRPVVSEAVEHINPVHREVVGLASVRPMRRKTDLPEYPKPEESGAFKAQEQDSQEIALPESIQAIPEFKPEPENTVANKAVSEPVLEMPSEQKLESLDRQLPPVEMPEENRQITAPQPIDDDGLPPAALPVGVDMEDDGFDLPPADLPSGVDMEADDARMGEPVPVENTPAPVETSTPVEDPILKTDVSSEEEVAPVPEEHGHVQTELMELLGEAPAPPKQKGKRPRKASPAKKKRGKRGKK